VTVFSPDRRETAWAKENLELCDIIEYNNYDKMLKHSKPLGANDIRNCDGAEATGLNFVLCYSRSQIHSSSQYKISSEIGEIEFLHLFDIMYLDIPLQVLFWLYSVCIFFINQTTEMALTLGALW
jgi:hypothetical protein